MNPQAAAVNEYLHLVAQSIDEPHRGVEIETDQVDHRIRTKLDDSSPERPIMLCGVAIERYMFDRLPFASVVIRSSRSAGYSHDLVPLVNQTRHQPRTDMSGRSDDYGAQL